MNTLLTEPVILAVRYAVGVFAARLLCDLIPWLRTQIPARQVAVRPVHTLRWWKHWHGPPFPVGIPLPDGETQD